jgi:hypothetical protein
MPPLHQLPASVNITQSHHRLLKCGKQEEGCSEKVRRMMGTVDASEVLSTRWEESKSERRMYGILPQVIVSILMQQRYVIAHATPHTTPFYDYSRIHLLSERSQKLWIHINIIIRQLNNVLHPSTTNLQPRNPPRDRLPT